MTERFHRPVRMPGEAFEAVVGGADPAATSRVAHDTAAALLHRIRGGAEPGRIDRAAIERLVAYTDAHGIDEFAELWSRAAAHSLPGALWRLYVIRAAVRADPDGASWTFRRGAEVDRTISRAVAGAVTPTGPRELEQLIDEILRGAFVGDFEIALERASAFCRIMSQGAIDAATDGEDDSPDRARELTLRAARYLGYAEDLHVCAQRWADGVLD